jgi:Sulfotransferase family
MMAPVRFGDALDLIHDQAASLAGSDDFGPDDYLPGLRIILRSVDSDTHMTPDGRELAWGNLLYALASRASVAKGLKEHPRALEERIVAPLVITGVPRTGTTALHKLISMDSQFQGIPHWLALTPVPRPPREEWQSQPGYERARLFLQSMFASVPEFRAAHNIVVDEVDECLEVLRQSFVSNRWACTWKAPSYDAWWQTQSERAAYRYYARTLQLIGHGHADQRWLLKNPGHIATLDLLFEVFPDAHVVHTHRSPLYTVPSISSNMLLSHRMYEGAKADQWAKLLGPREMEKWADALRRAKPVRDAHRGQIFHVYHRQLAREPMRVVRELYDHFGLELSQPTEAKMLARIQASPETRYGEHRYDLETFGLSKEEILERYAEYIAEFNHLDGHAGHCVGGEECL